MSFGHSFFYCKHNSSQNKKYSANFILYIIINNSKSSIFLLGTN